ncbi:MAG: response regulator, partial [Blastocatellia bacterium]
SLLSLINDILDFSKIEAGKLEVDSTDFSLRACLETSTRVLALRAHAKEIELVCDVAGDVPDHLVGDRGRVRQVLINLTGNAIKFTDSGEVVVRVRTRSQSDREVTLLFEVADTGIGIPADKLGTIFEAFEQADASTTRKYGGTGLGLAISAKLARMMGGEIWVSSKEGEGSTFSFTAEFGVQQRAAEPAWPGPTGLDRLPILVVDDNETNRSVLEAILKSWNAAPTTAASGLAALRLLKQASKAGRPFALLLLDFHMPGMDGLAVADRVASDPDISDTKIILLTPANMHGVQGLIKDGKLSGCLTKPVTHSSLLETIMKALGAGFPCTNIPQPAIRLTGSQGLEGLRVLMVDDNEVNRRLGMKMLEGKVRAVTVASSGKQAVELYAQNGFDLILMDVQMPNMNGLEATNMIREIERASRVHIPIVAMTARAMKGDREECLAAGMDGYVSKPIRLDELFDEIRSVMTVGTAGIDAENHWMNRPAERDSASLILDAQTLIDDVNGDIDFLKDLTKLFIGQYPKLLGELHRIIAVEDTGQLAELAHKVKGSVGGLRGISAYETAARLEKLAVEGNLGEAAAALDALEYDLELLKDELEKLPH